MFFYDHNPPHFHVSYGEYKAVFDIENEVIRGVFPKRAAKMIFEWYELHKEEIHENWVLASNGLSPKKIEPLK